MSFNNQPISKVNNVEGALPQSSKSTLNIKQEFHDKVTLDNAKKGCINHIPVISWLPKYDYKLNAGGDLVAGVTVGVMLIPQGMAYSLLAGLPPEYGLYASVIPIMIYAFLGTSRQLAVGPVAMVSLLISEALHTVELQSNGLSDAGKVQISIILSLLVGLFNIVFSLLHLGVVAQLLSHSVLVGFTAGAAVIIGLSQLKHVMGFSIPSSPYPLYTLGYALAHIADTNVATLVMSIVTIAILLLLRTIKRKIIRAQKSEQKNDQMANGTKHSKGYLFARGLLKLVANVSALVVVVIGTSVTASVDAEFGNWTVPVVGNIPSGFPKPIVPDLSGYSEYIPQLLVSAIVITILGFMESYAVAGTYARQNNYVVEPNQELFALGFANFCGSFFNAFPVTGGFSRTAVNADSGAATPLASIVSSLVVLISIFFLTGAFEFLPKAVLASIIFVAVSGLFNFTAMKFAWNIERKDFLVMMLTFIGTISLGVEIGLVIGFVGSFIVMLKGVAYPHSAVLGKVQSPDTGEFLYRNVKRYTNAETDPTFIILRVDAPIWFANTDYVKSLVWNTVADDTKYVVLDFSSVASVDLTGIEMLHELQDELNEKLIGLVLASVKGPVRDKIHEFNTFVKKYTPSENPLATWMDEGGSKMNCMTRTLPEAEQFMRGESTEETLSYV